MRDLLDIIVWLQMDSGSSSSDDEIPVRNILV
jgi:hypothetical protein